MASPRSITTPPITDTGPAISPSRSIVFADRLSFETCELVAADGAGLEATASGLVTYGTPPIVRSVFSVEMISGWQVAMSTKRARTNQVMGFA